MKKLLAMLLSMALLATSSVILYSCDNDSANTSGDEDDDDDKKKDDEDDEDEDGTGNGTTGIFLDEDDEDNNGNAVVRPIGTVAVPDETEDEWDEPDTEWDEPTTAWDEPDEPETEDKWDEPTTAWDEPDEPEYNGDSTIEEWIDENGGKFISDIKSGAGSTQLKTSIEGTNDSIIVELYLTGINNLTYDVKEQFKENMSATFEQFTLDLISRDYGDLPSDVEEFIINYCEEDGDIIASVVVDEDGGTVYID